MKETKKGDPVKDGTFTGSQISEWTTSSMSLVLLSDADEDGNSFLLLVIIETQTESLKTRLSSEYKSILYPARSEPF